MKLYLEDDNGEKIEVTPLQELDSKTDLIVLMSKMCWSKKSMTDAEKYYTQKFGKKVVIVDGAFDKILGIAKKDDASMQSVT